MTNDSLEQARVFMASIDIDKPDYNKVVCGKSPQLESYIGGYFWRGYRIKIPKELRFPLWCFAYDLAMVSKDIGEKEIRKQTLEEVRREYNKFSLSGFTDHHYYTRDIEYDNWLEKQIKEIG
jgi:hypothetical protein